MKKKVINVLRYLLFLFLVLVVVFPILFIFMSSLKQQKRFTETHGHFLSESEWTPILPYLRNMVYCVI